ncbi:MAG: hypothetical protein WA913_07500 [Pricia sp.]
MNQNPEKYYVIHEDWSLDPNQWSMLIDGIAVLLAIFGVVIAYLLYLKQRRDKANDAFDFFQASLPEFKDSIVDAIEDLKEFNRSLDLDNFVNPVLSASLNDKFLKKVSLVDLNRFYAKNRKDKFEDFKSFLIDSNFFGDYHSYISKEINYFQTNYQKRKNDFSQWRLLRSNPFFSTPGDDPKNSEYKNFYSNWTSGFLQNKSIFHLNEEGHPTQLKNRQELVGHVENLASGISPFIASNAQANKVDLITHQVVSAHTEMLAMRAKIRGVLEKDIAKFEEVLANVNHLLEQK